MLTKLSLQLCGITKHDAHKANICINCKQKVLTPCGTEWDNKLVYSPQGQREYSISALCEKCFDQSVGNTND